MRLAKLTPLLCVLVAVWLVIVPLGALFYTAFTEDALLGETGATLQNFVEAYAGWQIVRLFANSLVYAAGTAAATLVMGGFVAWVVERTDAPGGALFHVLALMSFAIPGLLMAMAWIFIFSPNIGWANGALKSLFGLTQSPVNIYTMGGMIWALSSHYFPLVYLALGPALRALDTRMEEAGQASGASAPQILARITFPLLRPALWSTVLLVFVMGMSSYEVPRLIGRPARIDVFTTQIQVATQGSPPEFGVASALSLTLLVICLVAVYVYRSGVRDAESFATVTGKGYVPNAVALGRWRWPVALAVGLMFAVALGLPLATLAWQSCFRNLAPLMLSSTAAATLANYSYVLTYPIFLDAVRTSVLLAAMTATIVAGLTLVMAWIAQRSGSRFAWLIDALAFAPIAVPSVIVGASILLTYLMLPLHVYHTIWILLVAYVTICLPYGMRFASSGLTQIHRELEEAAEVAGAGLIQVFRRVLLPLLAPVLLAAWIYVFVLSVRELGASVFLTGPGTAVLGTIGLTMWEEGGSYGAVSALGIVQIVPLLIIVAALRWLETRVHRRIAPTEAGETPDTVPQAQAA